MNRREYLAGAAALASLVSLQASAADTTIHAAHDHGANLLFDAAQDCVRTAQLCQAHCQQLLASGDGSLVDCFDSVNTLLPVCETLAALAAQRSAFLPRYAKLAAEVCRSCEQACRKHEREHTVCRDCAEACVRCAKQCDAAAA